MSTDATTETPETPETGAESDAAGTNPAGEGQDTGHSDQGDQSPNAEAAGYRRRLRETESERDVLQEHLQRHRTRELERTAGEILSEPADLLSLGEQDLDAFLTDEGDVDTDAVRAAARALTERRPGLGVPRASGPIGQGRNTGTPPKAKGGAWADLLQQ